MRKMLFLLLAIATSATAWSQAQPDYIPEQLGRDAHHIIQSLGAFVGNEKLRITENPSTTSRYRSFKFTINQ